MLLGLSIGKFMKLVFIESYFPPPVTGGKEKQLYILVQSLFEKKTKVKVLTKLRASTQSDISELNCVQRFSNNRNILSHLTWLAVSSKRNETVFYINTPSRIGQISVLICSIFGQKTIFKVSSQQVLDFLKNDSLRSRFILKNVSLFHVLSADDLKSIQEAQIADKQILLSYNGVAIPEQHIESYNGSNKLQLLYVGRINRNKNLLTVIKAIHKLNTIDGSKNIELEICGDGEGLAECVQYVNEYDLDSTIKFLGFLAPYDVTQHIINADFLILSSFAEGMSNSLLEAASFGLPIICSRVGGYKEILGDFSDTFTFDPTDENELIAKLTKAQLSSKEERKVYGDYLRSRCIEVFSIDKSADRILDACRSLWK